MVQPLCKLLIYSMHKSDEVFAAESAIELDMYLYRCNLTCTYDHLPGLMPANLISPILYLLGMLGVPTILISGLTKMHHVVLTDNRCTCSSMCASYVERHLASLKQSYESAPSHTFPSMTYRLNANKIRC